MKVKSILIAIKCVQFTDLGCFYFIKLINRRREYDNNGNVHSVAMGIPVIHISKYIIDENENCKQTHEPFIIL